jgi:leader peptidase (prepilin peptidase)/N-methyltransferase
MSWQGRRSEFCIGSGPDAADVSRVDVLKRVGVGVVGLLAVAASLCARPGIPGQAGAGLAVIMLAIAIIDWRLLVIPDELNALAIAFGVGDVCFQRWEDMPGPALNALVRGAGTAALFFAFRFLYRRFRGREGLGLGDVKLAGVAGVWLDWTILPIAVEIAALGALGFVALRGVRSRRAPDPLAKLPFGTFLAPSIWLCWLLARWWNY